ncbi:peptidoglycan-binding protein [Jiella mangrovi]|uniref:SEL1-like repeat protein n=1 Tax=Jiella mangrovi TaxID=2821407 RepID=A0ABS4BEK5_9HYPH|nr:peptidoglycan-binding protein [Jiella mangrovi]MBP0614601.1 SEL1-like repeat protein [Jiella mangrovi]
MADLKGMEAEKREVTGGTTSLETLNRTLEELEARLSRLTASHARAAADLRHHESGASVPGEAEEAPASMPRLAAGAGLSSPRADLSKAVSEIVTRQRALNRPQRSRHPSEDAREASSERRRSFAGEERETITELPVADAAAAARLASRSHRTSGPTIVEQLERLREELRTDMAKSFQPRFDDMREAVDDLRRMIADRASTDRIDAEIARVHEGLAQMATTGADENGVKGLRSELESIRTLVKDLAREESLKVADEKWDDIRETINTRDAASVTERRDIKDELERLRLSLGSLASEEHVKAFERRWDEFESRYLDKPEREEGPEIGELLKSEMASLRDKLETLASEQSVKAVEERWGSLEERFASRGIEQNIETLSSRMEQLEQTLSKLPDSFALEPIEARLRALSEGLEALGNERRDESDDAHFQALDERLDEISRAIVAAATKAPPVDMSPVERVEARLQALASRVDSLGEADVDAMSARIAELNDRIEGLSNAPAIAALAERIEAFSAHLESLAAIGAAPSPDVSAIEARLAALNSRLEAFSAPALDPEIVAALEDQIIRLSDRIAEVGSASALSDPELDERLATIEFRIEENREAIMESAEAAAEAAVRRMVEDGDGRQSAYVEQLASDLRSLQEMSRASGEQSQSFYEAMHATLLKLVDRIDRIDTDLSQGRASDSNEAQTAAPTDAEEAPRGLRAMLKRRGAKLPVADVEQKDHSDKWQEPEFADYPAEEERAEYTDAADGQQAEDELESQEANRPLAVGSGQPDIVSLIERVRAQQAGRAEEDTNGKADFIAAARRAALAAAAEADAMRASPEIDPEATTSEGIAAKISRRRKPILLAISAILLALLAVPAAKVATQIVSAPVASSSSQTTAEGVAASEDARPSSEAAEDDGAATDAATDNATGQETQTAADDTASAASGSADVADRKSSSDVLAQPASPTVPKNGFSLDDGPAQAGFATQEVAQSAASPASAPSDDGQVAEPASAASAPASESVPQGPAQQASIDSADLPTIPEGVGPEPLINAAKAGDPKALFEIGLRLMEGRAGAPDPALAAKWFSLSADRGFAPAQYSLGTLYEKGNGVEKDLAKARDEYLKAADGGNVRAMHNLAVLYATGIDGKSAPAKAAKWFEMAASYGMTDSQYNLGILYARGAGVDQDMVKSYKWFSIVAKEGDADAAGKRDEIKKALTPEQLKTADAEIAAYSPLPRDDAANTVDIPKDWRGDSAKTETSSIDMARAIRNIQAILIKLGYEPGAPDGVIGDKTTNAIEAFQKDSGLQPTGKVDEALIRKLLERKDG